MNDQSNIAEYLLKGREPNRIALRGQRRDYTYGELDAASSECARRLLEGGAVAGDRILLLNTNSFHWAVAYLGILRARMVCVPLPVHIEAAELAFIIDSVEPRFAFVQNLQHTAALEAIPRIYEGTRKGPAHFEGPDAPLDPLYREPIHGDLAALMFTSGSTGKPRGVMVTHRNIIANTNSILASLPLHSEDRVMAVLPFHYCFGTSLLHTCLRLGASLVIETSFTYPEMVLNRMEGTACTCFAGVPSHYQILLRNSTLKRRSLPHLRSLLQAGGHLAPAFVQELQQAVPHAQIYVMYGQTEATARLACLEPEMLASKPGSIGKAIPGVTLHVMNASGAEAKLGEIGEIVVEGDNVTLGYWRAPDETALSFHDGKLHTGDMATKDADGYLYILDRSKDFVKCGGTRTSCRHLEDCLLACEELMEAAVVGMPDEVLGEAICAYVVPRPQTAPGLEERLRSFCRSRLTHALIPKDIRIVNSLPKNSSGKLERWRLKSSSEGFVSPSVSQLKQPSSVLEHV